MRPEACRVDRVVERLHRPRLRRGPADVQDLCRPALGEADEPDEGRRSGGPGACLLDCRSGVLVARLRRDFDLQAVMRQPNRF